MLLRLVAQPLLSLQPLVLLSLLSLLSSRLIASRRSLARRRLLRLILLLDRASCLISWSAQPGPSASRALWCLRTRSSPAAIQGLVVGVVNIASTRPLFRLYHRHLPPPLRVLPRLFLDRFHLMR